ncbi:hypothetical protein SADUNF_Sadunf02G0098500 [Salix dunnii]|uniref:Uncharacterized protein n=1 Tax=Salix dunnii TaxID=1413687 RepID=A0A835N745_9ROSI|nr:hypothetical protein SADUNF_Sadunf02G0098500 [Salix dunnii]
MKRRGKEVDNWEMDCGYVFVKIRERDMWDSDGGSYSDGGDRGNGHYRGGYARFNGMNSVRGEIMERRNRPSNGRWCCKNYFLALIMMELFFGMGLSGFEILVGILYGIGRFDIRRYENSSPMEARLFHLLIVDLLADRHQMAGLE